MNTQAQKLQSIAGDVTVPQILTSLMSGNPDWTQIPGNVAKREAHIKNIHDEVKTFFETLPGEYHVTQSNGRTRAVSQETALLFNYTENEDRELIQSFEVFTPTEDYIQKNLITSLV